MARTTTFSQATDYRKRGEDLPYRAPRHADPAAQEHVPQWRAGMFSIAHPLPTGFEFKSFDLEDSPWILGRYRGLKSFTPTPSADRQDPAVFTHYTEAKAWFGASLINAVQANSVDPYRDGGVASRHLKKLIADNTTESKPDSLLPGGAICRRLLADDPDRPLHYHATRESILQFITEHGEETRTYLDNSDFSDASLLTGANYTYLDYLLRYSREGLKQGATCAEMLEWFGTYALTSGSWLGKSSANDSALLQLQAIEYVQFPHHETAATTGSKDYDHYLVFHVVAENCDDLQLEAISRALDRPRSSPGATAVKEFDWHGTPTASPRAGRLGNFQLLKNITCIAEYLLNSDDLAGATQTFFMNDGGYLVPAGKPAPTPEDSDSGRKQIDRVQRHRSVVAIPNRPIASNPQLWPDAAHESDSWTREASWAWQLATGADQYHDRIPSQSRLSSESESVDDIEDWHIATVDSGVAAVRTNTYYTGNPKITLLASTRFVDILLLNMRTFTALSALSAMLNQKQELSAITLGSSKALSERLTDLNEAQIEFAEIRNVLWTETIPRRSTGTAILHGLRDTSGVRRMYEDVSDDLNLRSDIYSSIYQQITAKEREQQQDVDKARQEAKDEARNTQNLLLGAIGVVVGAPSIVEMAGVEPGLTGLLWTIGIALALAGAFFLWLRWSAARHSTEGVRPESAPYPPESTS
ncbi:hypothetical protein [Corynebacterium doosanense]|nr:hypothetical protein [Corynebacterium doosanense]